MEPTLLDRGGGGGGGWASKAANTGVSDRCFRGTVDGRVLVACKQALPRKIAPETCSCNFSLFKPFSWSIYFVCSPGARSKPAK